jgi:hypothetical protein
MDFAGVLGRILPENEMDFDFIFPQDVLSSRFQPKLDQFRNTLTSFRFISLLSILHNFTLRHLHRM